MIDPDHALLMGNVIGAMGRFAEEWGEELPTKIQPLFDDEGNCTNQIRIIRPSGSYLVTIEREP